MGEEETALIFGKRERALAVWSMNGLLESSAMDGEQIVMNNGHCRVELALSELPEAADRYKEPDFRCRYRERCRGQVMDRLTKESYCKKAHDGLRPSKLASKWTFLLEGLWDVRAVLGYKFSPGDMKPVPVHLPTSRASTLNVDYHHMRPINTSTSI